MEAAFATANSAENHFPEKIEGSVPNCGITVGDVRMEQAHASLTAVTQLGILPSTLTLTLMR